MLKGHVFKDQLFENHIFALFMNTFLAGHNGIINGYKNSMNITYSGSNVTINSGVVCVQGRFLEEDSSKVISAGTNTLFCKLVLTINLDRTNTENDFQQGYYEILTGASAYPSLTQQDIISSNSGKYQFELAQFKTGLNGISDFVDKRTYLDFNSIYEELATLSILLHKSGGTMTGELISRKIRPSADRTYDLGSSGALWRYIYAMQMILPYTKFYEVNGTSIAGVVDQLSVRAPDDYSVWKPMSASAFNQYSSKRYKENIKDMTEEEANKILGIDAKIFDYKNEKNGTNVAGVIAEDVYEVIPNVVTLAKVDGEYVPDSVDYSKFAPYFLKEIQMLRKDVDELKK